MVPLRRSYVVLSVLLTRRYYEALSSCCLDYDLSTFPNGDEKNVGCGGANLFGTSRKHRLVSPPPAPPPPHPHGDLPGSNKFGQMLNGSLGNRACLCMACMILLYSTTVSVHWILSPGTESPTKTFWSHKEVFFRRRGTTVLWTSSTCKLP